MTALTTLKTKYITEMEKAWEYSVRKIRELLNYDRATLYKGFQATDKSRAADALVRKLAKRLFTVSDSTRQSVWLGGVEYGFGIVMHSYGPAYSVVSLMDLVDFFVGHEILDDGEPCVAYYRNTMRDKPRKSNLWERCGKDAEGAMPYFHRSYETASKEGFGKPERLTAEKALEVLEIHEAERRRMGESLQKSDLSGSGFSQEHIDQYLKLSPEDQMLADLAEELIDRDV
jgi:hypothetical protein